MAEPPEAIEAGEHFRFFAEVTSVCNSAEVSAVPAGERVSLVASAPRYGLLFAGQGGVLQVYSTVALSRGGSNTSQCSVWCGGRITHVSRTCDSLTLLVTAVWTDDIPHILFFDVRTMVQQGARLVPYLQCCGSNVTGSRLTALVPSPTDPGCLALCTSTGDLTVLSVSENSVSYNTKKGIGAGAVGWSAKGKQLCVGCSNGALALFKPDLTPVRVIAAPSSLPQAPVTALVWFTNTEFFVCYQQDNSPTLVYVNGPKDKPAQYLSYEDVCYSSEGSAPQYYHLCYVPEWNQLFVLSSGGVEMATLIKCDGGGWAQLFLDEGHRAEMHFVNVTQETYPLGVALDFASTKTFSVKEDQSEGPFPVLYTLSTGGELNIFHMGNKLPGATDLCATNPVERIPSATSVRTPQQYGMNIVIPQPPPPAAAPAPAASTQAPAASLFGGATPGAGSAFSSVGVPSSAAAAAPFSSFGGVPPSSTVSSVSAAPGAGGGGMFGSFAPPPSGSLFGGAAATSTATSTPALSSSSSLFSLTPSAPTSSLFGGKPPVSSSSLFGGSTAGASLFGSSAPAVAATSSGSSLFGGTAVSTSFAFPSSTANSGSILSSNNSATTTTTASSIFGGGFASTTPVPTTQTFSAQVVTASSSKGPAVGSAPLVPSSTSFSQGMAFNFSAPGSASGTGSTLQGSGAASQASFLAPNAGMGSSKPSSTPPTPTTPVSQHGPASGTEAPPPPPAYSVNPSAVQIQSPKPSLSSGPNSARQTPVREVAKARTAQQDKALMAQITEEQDRFDKELKEHFRTSEQCEYKGGWEESMRSVQSELSDTEESLVQHRKQSRELSDAVAELHTILLEFYSGYEDAKTTCNRINDPDQAYLTEWRGLDRCSERWLQDLRSKLHYIQSELSYANATLDTIASNRLNKQNNARNKRVGGGVPGSGGSEDVYRTVMLTHNARLACERQVDQLVEKMGGLNVLSGHPLRTSSASNAKRTNEGKYGISNDSLLVSFSEDNKENVNNISSNVSALTPAKQEKLWDLLQQRKTTPVRRSGRPAYSPSVDNLSSPINRSRLVGNSTLASTSQFLAAAPSPTLSALPNLQRHPSSLLPSSAAPSLPSTPVQGRVLNTPDRSLLMSMSSFGPPTKCSTPAAEPSPPATSQTGLKFGGGLREQLGANLMQGKPPGLTPDGGAKGFSNWQVPASSIASAFQASSAAPSFAASSIVKTEMGQHEFSTPKSAGASTPKYEDITPPGTPDIPNDAAAADELSSAPKAPTNPLSALSSLVGKVPTISTAATVPAQGFFSASTQSSSSLFAAIPPGSTASAEPTQVSGIMSGKPFSGFSSSASVSVASSPTSFGSSSGSAFAAKTKAFSLLPGPESPALSSGGVTPATTSSAFNFGSSSFSLSTATTSAVPSSPALTSSFAVSSADGAASSKAGGGSSLFSAPATSSSLFSSLPNTKGSLPFSGTVPPAPSSSSSLFAGSSAATSQPSLFGSGKGLFASAESAVIKSEPATSTLPSFSVATAVKTEPLTVPATSSPAFAGSDQTVSSATKVPFSEKQSGLISSLPSPSSVPGVASSTSASSASSSSGLFALASAASTSPSLFGALSRNSAITITAVTTSAHTSAPTLSTLTITPSTEVKTPIVVPSFDQVSSPAIPSAVATQSSSSLFGQASSSVSSATTISAPSSQATSLGSLFAAPASGGSLFSAVPTATSTASVFGGASASPFGTPASSGSGSIFASSAATGSVFGAPEASGSSIFAASTTTTSASFGAPVTTASSVFGGLPVASSSSAFGAPTSAASPFASSASVFGGPAAASSGTSLFGGQPPTSGSSTSVFGSGSTFGTAATPAVSGGSLFGGATSGGSVFGGGNGSASNSASVFGGAAAFGSSGSSAFGGGSAAGSGAVFGGGDSSGAGVTSVFGSSAAAPGSSSNSVFGGAAASPAASGSSVFGGSASSFGPTGQGTTSVFGAAPPAAAGGNSAFGSNSSSSAFGANSAFGNNSAGGASLFGNSNSMFTGLGAKPSSPTNKNVFGGSTGAVKPQTVRHAITSKSTTDGRASQRTLQSNLDSDAESTYLPSDLFGGPGSSGAGVASPSLFGGSSAAAQARPSPAFGSSATFGSPPKFGSGPAFGSSPAFGGAAGSAFGGGSVFGATTAAPPGGPSLFGGSSAGGGGGGGSGFSSFANSPNTATFGGLAANSDSSTGFGAPTAGSNASVFPKPNAGSSSFNSWR